MNRGEICTIVIAKRFCGPPTSGNGGYTCALVAQALGGTAEVTLRKPIPIERELQMAVVHFAYPNGRVLDIAPECPTLLRDGGFKTAVTTVYGTNDDAADLFHLKRIWVEPYLEMSYFQQRVSGLA